MSEALFPQAAPGFDEPLQLLLACHGRMEQNCALLLRLLDHLAEKGLDAEAQTAIGRIRNYFNIAARHHHHDEEEDLFPQLVGLDELLATLQDQHRELEQLWQTLDQRLLDASLDLESLRELATAFVAGYRQHIEVENNEVLPVAAAQLNERQLHQLGAAMARRRKGSSPAMDSDVI